MRYNHFNWADLFLHDFKTGRQFYAELFSWQYDDVYENDKLVYSMASIVSPFEDRDRIFAAGVAPYEVLQCEDGPQQWGLYILVRDIDATVEKIVAAGGTLYKAAWPVRDIGHIAVCGDIEGAVFNLWQPLSFGGAESIYQPGAVVRYELTCENTEQCIKFYQEVFGWHLRTVYNCNKRWYQFLNDNPTIRDDDSIVAGLHDKHELTGGHKLWIPYFRVLDINETLKFCVERGATVIYGPYYEPRIEKFAVVSDAEDNLFGVTANEWR